MTHCSYVGLVFVNLDSSKNVRNLSFVQVCFLLGVLHTTCCHTRSCGFTITILYCVTILKKKEKTKKEQLGIIQLHETPVDIPKVLVRVL